MTVVGVVLVEGQRLLRLGNFRSRERFVMEGRLAGRLFSAGAVRGWNDASDVCFRWWVPASFAVGDDYDPTCLLLRAGSRVSPLGLWLGNVSTILLQ